MAYYHSMHEVYIFYQMIESDIHTFVSCRVYGSSSNKQQKYIRVKKCIGPSQYIRAYVYQVALLNKLGCLKLPEGHETPHLCHNKQCINMDHLIGIRGSQYVPRCMCKWTFIKRNATILLWPWGIFKVHLRYVTNEKYSLTK